MSVSVASVSSSVPNLVTALKAAAPEAPSAQQSATPSTIVSISAESSEEEDAKALADFLASGPGSTLQMLSGQEQLDNYINEFQKFTVEPMQKANSSLTRVSAELVRLQDRIEASRPSMLGKKWDFVLKDQQIEVVNDNLNAKDRQWLENVLNKNQKLVSSVTSFYGAVVQRYDHTQDHAMATLRNSAGYEDGYVFDAADQINGKLAVRDMMDKTIASLGQPGTYISPDTRTPFRNSIELSASYFEWESEPKFLVSRYDMSDPATAQYFKDRPDDPRG